MSSRWKIKTAKSRFLKGKKTKIILYIPKDLVVYDEYLYVELGKYAEIYHFDDVFLKKFLNWQEATAEPGLNNIE